MLVTSFHHPAVSQSSHKERFELREVAQSTRGMTACPSWPRRAVHSACRRVWAGAGPPCTQGCGLPRRMLKLGGRGFGWGRGQRAGEVDVQPP